MRVGESLQIRELSASRPATSANRLHYALTLSNSGSKFSGTLEFTLTGRQNGTAATLNYPDPARRGEGPPSISVRRHLKTDGWLPLPEGFTPETLAVRLHDGEGIRATRTITLAPPT